MKRLLLGFLVFFSFTSGWSQVLEGRVMSGNEGYPGASIGWMKTGNGTISGEDGSFKLAYSSRKNDRLIISAQGFLRDTLEVSSPEFLTISLQKNVELNTVTIEEKEAGTHISRQNPIKTEVITERELEKAACCDLAGCFETEASVQPTTTNVITNARELRILGLSGVYNQVLIEGFPLIQGLSYTYGISSVPGPLVRKIYVAKGANSVLQGFESIAGQINVELKDPLDADKLFLNIYANSFLETQYNGHITHKGKGYSTLLSANMVQPARDIDRDGDDFLDVSKLRRYHVLNKWQVGDENTNGFFTVTGARFFKESRLGGQEFFDPEIHRGDTFAYGQTAEIMRPEFYTKTGFRFNQNHAIVGFASGSFQDQTSWFGSLRYDARQWQGYANLQYEWRWQDKHQLKAGTSLRYLDLDEEITFGNDPADRTYDGVYHRDELIPGVFAENTFRLFDGNLTLIAGARYDHHSQFGGRFTPRSLINLNVGANGSLRASAGMGWRTVNLFSENINLLASSRDVIIVETPHPESAVNYGINYTHTFSGDFLNGSIGADLYRTEFRNQIFPDYDVPGIATIRNFRGESVSNSFQIEGSLEFLEMLSLKLGYNYLDVYRKENGEKYQLPFNSRHRINATSSFEPLSGKWHVDVNLHWYGRQRLAKTTTNPPDFQGAETSDPYTVLNGQFTWKAGRFDFYGGCENIFDFRQLRPIVGWQDPFGPFFDTSSVWGPTRGREFYAGIRFAIP